MKTLRKLLPILTLIPLLLVQIAKAESGEPRVIKIKATDQMRFSVQSIDAQPGETIKIELTVVSNFPKMAMSHNFVLLKEGVDAMTFAVAAAKERDNDYIPQDLKNQILAHTALAGGGETVEVTFTVPQEPGSYQYICSFPGHYASGMKGMLTVKKQAS
ncbi:MAG: plastocyanin/azurin family copper-binding protein [Balneolaceae bacterium]|jgi:azurin